MEYVAVRLQRDCIPFPALHPNRGSHSQLLLQTSWDFFLSLDFLE